MGMIALSAGIAFLLYQFQDYFRISLRSYGWVANRIGKPAAVRAVGQALGKNPLPIIVPCHRVLASNGSLCGFGGGLEMKRNLLRLEGSTPGYQDTTGFRVKAGAHSIVKNSQ